jgi:NAD(P)-dependent dehydrogenase (short-subunit alcohol dehydrogenase family)
MNLGLQSKVALVTGGARDVGREIALELAAAGTAVAVNYKGSKDGAESVVREIQSRGGKAMAIGCDIANLDEVKAMVARAVRELGGLHTPSSIAGLDCFACARKE